MAGIALTVCRKEVLDNARDRRTLFSTLVFGPLFGPVLFAVLINLMLTQTFAVLEQRLSVPVIGQDYAPNLIAFLDARGIDADEDHALADLDAAAAAVRAGEHDVVLVIESDFATALAEARSARVTLVFDQSNRRAGTRVQRVQGALNAQAEQWRAMRLLARGMDPAVMRPMIIDQMDVSTPAGRSALLLGVLTYFLLFATLMGGFYLAIDTTAGERERKSLEPLLATPVHRSSLLLGKLGATVFYMLVSLALTLAAFTVALNYIPMEQLGMSSSFTVVTALKVFAVLVPFTPLGAALMIVVASFTKSYKEAQTYLGLLLVIPTLPLIFAMLLNVEPATRLMWIPSLSQHLLITSLLREDPFQLSWFALSTASTLGLAVVCGWIATRLYRREALLG